MAASIFADCFASCIGVIDQGSPGPICGWTFIQPFGATGGQFSFTPGMMSMDTNGTLENPVAGKPFASPLQSVFGITGHFEFTEFSNPTDADTTYQVILNNFDLSQTFTISFFGDGNVLIQAGDPSSLPTYAGNWTPNNGAHVVHFWVNQYGIPTLFLDGIFIPTAFFGNVLSASFLYPLNTLTYGGGASVAAPGSSVLRNVFMTAGIFGPETVFCCP